MDIQNSAQSQRFQQQLPPVKIFINDCNTFLSQAIVEELRTDHKAIQLQVDQMGSGQAAKGSMVGQVEHKLTGTMSARENAPCPNGIPKPLAKNRKKAVYNTILQSDYAIFDINQGGIEDVDAIVKFLKEHYNSDIPPTHNILHSDTPLTLIILSSVMSWASTPPKPPKQATDIPDLDDLTPEQIDEELTQEMLDRDFTKREPSTRYAEIKRMEELVLQMERFTQGRVRGMVVCCGVIYGHGERVLYEHFRKAWGGMGIPLLGDGSNIVPTIHVEDVAKLVKKIIVDFSGFIPDGSQYFLAVDHGKLTQAQIVKAIANANPPSKPQAVDIFDVYSEEWSDFLNINLLMRPSKLFSPSFPWTSKTSLSPSILPSLLQDFALYRNLSPVMIGVVGPPMAGKKAVKREIEGELAVKGMNINEMLNYCKTHDKHHKISSLIKSKEEELKQQIFDEHDKTKKKGQPELDKEQIKVKLSDEVISEAYKWMMKQDCFKLKGVICESYPKTMVQAQKLYYTYADHQHQEENDFKDATLHSELLPKLVFQLKISKENALQRYKLEMSGEHNEGMSEQEFERRWSEYENESKHVIEFFKSHNGIKVIEIDANTKSPQDLFKSHIRDKIFHTYKFLAYLHVSEDNEKELLEKLQAQEELELKEEQLRQDQQDQKQKQLVQQAQRQDQTKNKRVNSRLAKIEEKKHFLLETKSLPIRQYLMDKVLPTLTLGIMNYTDQNVDFSTLTNDQIDQGHIPFDNNDMLDYLIKFFEQKGLDTQKQYLDNKRKMIEMIEQMNKGLGESGDKEGLDESDGVYDEDESPGEDNN